eukprot:comp18570_c0_seq1/m.20069 comp18570_c0_seq1/g.20069  ORF comp18570_c0_seq1/g.20069 comp18570_c0_seq1/m.20069 type:complete len:128 (-) comp18570_c0_seq1:327-710(-)
MEDNMLYHLVPLSTWSECKATGKEYYPATYAKDGFIHLTKEPRFLLSVANNFYKDVKGDHVVVRLDATKLKAEVKFEPAAPVGDKATSHSGILFPHLYGTINYDAVVDELQVERADDGTYLDIKGLV